MKIVFLEADNLGPDMVFDRFSELGEVTIYGQTPDELIAKRIGDAEAVLVNKLPMKESTLKDAVNLRYIGITATGTNNVDFAYTNARGICVTNVAGYSTDVVAQHTFAMALYLMEHLRYYDDYVRSGAYTKSDSFCHMGMPIHELTGRTWGIIGLGAIGKKVARIAGAFGCQVIYSSPSGRNTDSSYRRVDTDTLLAESDIVSIHTPLTERTRHMMNYDAFCRMKKTAVFLNAARGPIVDEAGLRRALEEEKIAAAGLDVLEQEPMAKDSPLLALSGCERLLITPHMAWTAVETRRRLLDEVWMNLEAFKNEVGRNVCRG